jgi:hypothetical protein
MNKQRLIDIFEKNHPHTQMSENEMILFLTIIMSRDKIFDKDINEVDKTSEIYKHFEPIVNGFQMQIFLKRLEHIAKLRISFGAFIMIAFHLNNPGDAVMYAYYLFHKLPKNSFVGVDEIANVLFPWGFFSEEQLHKMWDEQKVRDDDDLNSCTCYGVHDNLLDYVEFWEKE